MAREVYFDPFGNYTRGYDQGTAREMEVQRGTRDARAQDLDYYGMAPLRLDNAQLENNFNHEAYPYKVNALGYADTQGRNATFASNIAAAEPAAFFGDFNPFAQSVANQYGYNPMPTADGSVQMRDAAGNPMGQPINSGATTAPYYYRKEGWDRDDTRFTQGVQGAQVEIQAQQANTGQYSAQAYAENMARQTAGQIEEARIRAGAANAAANFNPLGYISGMFAPNQAPGYVGSPYPQGMTPAPAPGLYSPAPNTPQSMAPQPAAPAPQAAPQAAPGQLTPDQVWQMYLQYQSRQPAVIQ